MSDKDRKQMPKIKEFEWYAVETKVREIMGDLLLPFNKKQTEETIKLNEMKRSLLAMGKQVQQHDFLLGGDQTSKPSYIQLQDDRILKVEQCLASYQPEVQNRIRKMELVIEVYEKKIQQLNELEKRVDREVAERMESFRKYKANIDELMDLMSKKQQAHQEDIVNFQTATRTNVTKLQLKIVSFENRIRETEDESKRIKADLNRVADAAVITRQKFTHLSSKLQSVAQKVQQREKDALQSQKFFSKVKQVQNELHFIQNYLQSYQPLYTQMQIAETLNSMVEGRQRRKLHLYEQKNFAKLHQHILQDEKLTLAEMMTNYSTQIRKIINRNRKYIVNLTVQESIRLGANVYEIRIDDIEDETESNNKAMNVIVPETEILRIIQQRWDKLTPGLTGTLKQELQPTRQWVKELQQQALMRSVELDGKYETIEQKCKQLEAEQHLQQKYIGERLIRLQNKVDQHEVAQVASRSHLQDLLNFSSVLNHIVIQDEIDRQGITLYALQSNGNANNRNGAQTRPTVQLNSECLNCESKNKAVITQAFKMACLSYSPSQIRIDEQSFSREQILQVTTNILQRLKKKIQEEQTNNRPVQPDKRFNKTVAVVTSSNYRNLQYYPRTDKKAFTMKGSSLKSDEQNSLNKMREYEPQKEFKKMLPTLSPRSSSKQRPVKYLG